MTTDDIEAYIARLQAEADKYGFHPKLKAWVGPNDSVVRVLRNFAKEQSNG